MGQEYGVFVTKDGKSWGMYFKGTNAYQAAMKNRVLLFSFGKKTGDGMLWQNMPFLTRIIAETFKP
jgi:hypothetical protein